MSIFAIVAAVFASLFALIVVGMFAVMLYTMVCDLIDLDPKHPIRSWKDDQ